MRRSILMLQLCLAVSPVCRANAQTWQSIPAGQTSASLGSYLEGVFQAQLGFCVTGNPKQQKSLTVSKGLSRKTLSAVPPPLNDPSLKLSGTIDMMPDQSVGRAFAYVYPSQSVQNVTNPNGGNYLIGDYLENHKLLTLKGFDWAFYDYSCSSSIAAQMKANAGYTFPIAQVSAAMQADASSKTSYTLGLVSGTMYSPLWSMYNSTESQAYSTYGQLLVWEWYRRHSGAASDGAKRYLLSQFNGVSLYKMTTTSTSDNGQANISGSITTAVANMSLAVQGTYESSTDASVGAYGLVIRRLDDGTGSTAIFQDFPSVSDLVAALSRSAAAHLDPSSTDNRLLPTTTHAQVITGIPQTVCANSDWRLDTSAMTMPPNSVLALAGKTVVAPDPNGNTLPGCRFVVSFTTDPNSQLNHISLDYSLVNDLKNNAGTPIASAKIKADLVSLTSSGLPSIHGPVLSSTGVPTTSTSTQGGIDFYQIAWNEVYSVTEDTVPAEKISSVVSQPATLTMTCGGTTISSVSPSSANLSYSNQSLSLAINISPNSASGALDTSHFVVCTLAGRINFNLASGPVSRDLPVSTVLFPKAVVTPPAQSPTAPTPTPTKPQANM